MFCLEHAVKHFLGVKVIQVNLGHSHNDKKNKCVCVCLHVNLKTNRCWNMKMEYFVVYEKSWDEFDFEHCRIKVKVTVGFQVFPIYQLSVPTTQLWYKLGRMYVYLILIYKIYEYCHALLS